MPTRRRGARRSSPSTSGILRPRWPSLWAVDIEPRKVTQLTSDDSVTVGSFTISPDSKWVGFTGVSADRYRRNITEQNINGDPFLLERRPGRPSGC